MPDNSTKNGPGVSRTVVMKNPFSLARVAIRVSLSFIALAIGVPASSGNAAGPEMYPVKTFKHLIEIGQASWYGFKFQGRKTATGESYDMNLMTCAHRSLPLGSWVKVTNLKNRKTVLVRVNDRGPAFGDRIIDLSYAAAKAVGLQGIGKVRIDTLHQDDPDLTRMLLSQVQFPGPLVPVVLSR